MLLSDLGTRRGGYKVVLLQTNSTKLEMYLYDKVKSMYSCTQDTILDLKDKKDLKAIKEVAFTDSFLSDKWLVNCNIDDITSIMKDFVNVIAESNSVVFFCTCSKYKNFKKFLEDLKTSGVTEVAQYYLNSLRSADFAYLYNDFVPLSDRLNKNLYDFVYQGYSANIDAIMILLEELKSGTKFTSRKDISDICGLGGNTIESFLFALLKSPPNTDKGSKTVLKNRLKAGMELMSSYGISRFQNYMSSSLTKLVDLKVLEISGTVYKRIYNLPDGYDEKQLARYQRFLWRVKEIPMTRFLRLSEQLNSSRWSNDLDFALFVYAFLFNEIRYEIIPFIEKTCASTVYTQEKELEAKKKAEEDLEFNKFKTDKCIEYINKYGILEGRKRFTQEFNNLSSDSSVKSTKVKKSGKTVKEVNKGTLSGSAFNDDAKALAASFRLMYSGK